MTQYRKENFAPGSTDLQKYFAKGTLIPAVVQEASTGEVLMLAYMNEESLRKTMETGYTWFYSRSRQELWNKGDRKSTRLNSSHNRESRMPSSA